MKIASFYQGGEIVYGVVQNDGIITASSEFMSKYPSLKDVIGIDALSLLEQDVSGRNADNSLGDTVIIFVTSCDSSYMKNRPCCFNDRFTVSCLDDDDD